LSQSAPPTAILIGAIVITIDTLARLASPPNMQRGGVIGAICRIHRLTLVVAHRARVFVMLFRINHSVASIDVADAACSG
jgi:hypothetical protein